MVERDKIVKNKKKNQFCLRLIEVFIGFNKLRTRIRTICNEQTRSQDVLKVVLETKIRKLKTSNRIFKKEFRLVSLFSV